VVRGEGLAERRLPTRIAAYEASGRQEGRWVLACDLKAGDELLLRNDELVELESARLNDVEERVYNFEVAELQNYAVGSCGALVHNRNEGKLGTLGKGRPAKHDPKFPGLKEHARRHGGIGEIPGKPAAYRQHALQNIRNGVPYRFYHDGQFKIAYITDLGNGRYLFTSVSQNGKIIYTHMEVEAQYLRNLGITLSTNA